jgi:hypothetical protein
VPSISLHRRAIAVILPCALVLGACGAAEDKAAHSPAPSIQSSADSEPPPELAAGCEAYESAEQAWFTGTKGDQDFAAELEHIGNSDAAGTALEPPLRDMAKAFRSDQMNIDSAAIRDLCAGNAPSGMSAEEAQDRDGYLTRVRAEVPSLGGVADADLVAAAEQVCSVLDSGVPANSYEERSLVLNNIANTAMGHQDEGAMTPVVKAAVDTYCPQHASLVEP